MAPCYLLSETLLRRNLELIRHVAAESGAEIILAFKAYALWRTFPIIREYVSHTTASSPYEARLALEEFGSLAHTYSPAYTQEDFPEILRCSGHVTFNSLSQYRQFAPQVLSYSDHKVSMGLRVNPEYSEIETALYNPCAPGSRFGVLAGDLPDVLPEGIEGFHCHCHCESSALALQHTLVHLEEKFAGWFGQIKWLNLGGGHLLTRKGYDVELLIGTIRSLRQRYPHLSIILEPGSAFGWQTGCLVSNVVDVVENHGVRTAILNVSFTCHMPDCLEMPYQPAVRGAETLPPEQVWQDAADREAGRPVEGYVYRLGGNSCLSGDFMDCWRFSSPLKVGDEVIFEDMLHYTTVKTTMFNGIPHPAIMLECADGRRKLLREYGYEDYRDRMD
ncbi:MAG: carboxynorspermidine decarboxylase [Bacteroidaceae bacterium]